MKNNRLKIQALLLFISMLCLFLTEKMFANWQEQRTTFLESKKALIQAATAPETLQVQRQKLVLLHKTSEKQLAAIKSGGELLSYVEATCREQGVTLLSLPQERQQMENGIRLNELRFSLEGHLQDILTLSHRWEYHDQLGCLTYFKLARENIRNGRKRETKLVANLRFKRLL